MELTGTDIWNNLSKEDLPGELWLPVTWCNDGSVLCSNMGRIKSYTKNRKSFTIVKQTVQNRYCRTQIERDNKRKTFLTHREVAKLFVDNPLNLPEVNHKKGLKLDNRASELEWVDRFGNMQHAAKILKHFSGINSGRSKFTKQDVLKIFYSKGTDRSIAKQYSVSHSVIGFIRRGTSYKDELKGLVKEQMIFNSQKRLTKEVVLEIYHSDLSHRDTAAKFSVGETTVFNIRKGIRYANITGGLNNLKGVKRILSKADVLYIRSSKAPYQILADQFCLSKSSIKSVKSKRMYKWI